MDQEILSQFVAQPCCSICPLHFASVYVSDPCLQQSEVDSCIGGWPRFLPLKVLWVQSHPLLWLTLAISLSVTLSVSYSFSFLGLSSSAALGDPVPEYNILPHSSSTPYPQINKHKFRLTFRRYWITFIRNARKLSPSLLVWLERKRKLYCLQWQLLFLLWGTAVHVWHTFSSGMGIKHFYCYFHTFGE